jgi:hypothetical protein
MAAWGDADVERGMGLRIEIDEAHPATGAGKPNG